jgi:phenylalanyl-tRNA synthetase beta subunit
MTYSTLADFARAVLETSDFLTELSPVDIFQSETDATVKNVTVRIKLTARDHTITKDEAAAVVADVQTKVLAAIPQVEVVE